MCLFFSLSHFRLKTMPVIVIVIVIAYYVRVFEENKCFVRAFNYAINLVWEIDQPVSRWICHYNNEILLMPQTLQPPTSKPCQTNTHTHKNSIHMVKLWPLTSNCWCLWLAVSLMHENDFFIASNERVYHMQYLCIKYGIQTHVHNTIIINNNKKWKMKNEDREGGGRVERVKKNNKTKPSLFMQLNKVQTSIHTHTTYILDDMCVILRTSINIGALHWYSHHQALFGFVILPKQLSVDPFPIQ